ncbi:MAG TPA: alpha/beta hydrolase [Tepidisphaeraceae bacterium]|jgi:acetyl esterase/lipase|nr:alpha/beta hydrolase [Tepidisphaeraceae bacterium]
MSFHPWAWVVAAGSVLVCTVVQAQREVAVDDRKPDQVVRLWEGDAPGAVGTDDRDIPTLTVFLPAPDRANGTAVVICPGGGYAGLAPHEGKPVAEWLNGIGVTGFVLKYRLGPRYHHPAMMNDVNRAVRMVRAKAGEWKVNPDRIGVLGFSAGGHLTSTAVTHFDAGDPKSSDPVEHLSCRPDFGVLIYPVITLEGPAAHMGSRRNLLGDNPSPLLVESLSNQTQVTEKTPPCFLVHTSTDTGVPFENSLLFAEALQRHKVPVELHVFDHGPHGFGLGANDPVLKQWPDLCAKWMEHHGWLTREKSE